MSEASGDIWSQWLLRRRFGGDSERLQAVVDFLRPVRDKVLEGADLKEGEVLLDVGSGDGLIAFGAFEKAEVGRVIFSDVSQDLLDGVQAAAGEMGLLERCQFLLAPAEDLSALPDASVDAVTTRSVLIYVAEKGRAFGEFQRVLKPGGRLSIFEPINRFCYPEPAHLFWGYEVAAVQALAQKVKAVYDRHQPPDSDPMLDFDERDLLALAEQAGFRKVRLELQIEVKPFDEGVNWETYLQSAPNPKAPSPQEAIDEALTGGEAERFSAHLRPLVEAGQGVARSAGAYLRALK